MIASRLDPNGLAPECPKGTRPGDGRRYDRRQERNESARGGTRTRTLLRARDFKSLVSTIPPPGQGGLGEETQSQSRLQLNLS